MLIDNQITQSVLPLEPRTATFRILVVDDDLSILYTLQRAFKQLRPNFQVVTAPNGGVAWEKFQQEPFCLLLTVYAMPVMDGLELALRARNLRPEARVILMTGGIQLDLAAMVQQHNLAGHLNKPFAKMDIQNLLESLGF